MAVFDRALMLRFVLFATAGIALCLRTSATHPASRLLVDDTTLPTLGEIREAPNLHSTTLNLGQGVKWEGTIIGPTSTDFVRVHIYLKGRSTQSPWTALVLDATGNEIDRLAFSDFRQEGNVKAAWSKRIPGRVATVRLISEENLADLEIGVNRYIYQFSSPTIKNFIGGRDDREDLVLAYGKEHRFYQWGRPIAELTFVSSDSHKETNCTAFLLSSILLLTNAHCISQDWQVRTAAARFGLETGSTDQSTYQIERIVLTNHDLDFTLLRMVGSADAWGAVAIGSAAVKNERMVMIQQPNGGVKKIAVRKCQVQHLSASGLSNQLTDFYHLCDSEGGSSGAPLMDAENGAVVGLHHAGQWDPKTKDYHNLGVDIEMILGNLASCAPIACKTIASCRDVVVHQPKQSFEVCNSTIPIFIN
jgi:hypothetical protein